MSMDFKQKVVICALLLRLSKKKELIPPFIQPKTASIQFHKLYENLLAYPPQNIFHFSNQFLCVKTAFSLLPVIVRYQSMQKPVCQNCYLMHNAELSGCLALTRAQALLCICFVSQDGDPLRKQNGARSVFEPAAVRAHTLIDGNVLYSRRLQTRNLATATKPPVRASP
jgi:hypothetical protein